MNTRHRPLNTRHRPASAERIDDDFLRTYEHLARTCERAVAPLLPEVTASELHHLLVALGMAGTVVVQGHIQTLADNRYQLIVESGKGADTSLVVRSKRTNSQSGFNLRLIWTELLFDSPDHTELRSETVALLDGYLASSTHAGEGDRLTGFYSLLSTALREAPYDAGLRRIAHLPIMLLDVHAENRYGSPRGVDTEAQRRLGELYGRRREIAVSVLPSPVLKG